MKVHELIKKLQEYPQDSFVAVEKWWNCNWYNLEEWAIHLLDMYKTDSGSETYWDYCEEWSWLWEDWLNFSKEKVVMIYTYNS